MTTDVIACRLPSTEAERFKQYARKRGVPISVAIRELVNAALHDAPRPHL